MKIPRLSLLAVLAVPVMAAPAVAAPVVVPGPALVARYNFDGGAVSGRVAELSGRGSPLAVRGVGNGLVSFVAMGAGRFAAFPAPCAATAPSCAKALLEAPDDADLDPGTRGFRWAAAVRLTRAQLTGSANVVQKGVATTDSQWKMQIGGPTGRAQCVMVAKGSGQAYTALSAKPVIDGGWHRVVCQRSGTVLTISVDGVPGERATVPSTLSVDNNLPLRVGGPNFARNGDMYHGQVDDVYAQLG
ncbi:LamG-like jellyroll fold domain-containing protein [Actinoplanes sp. GCM10030250]|uniref:LamG-like jellyroll fold domain-containing protein n=1 Tax=Actinoplanes sp. GCM10030250 TaxID=3273376 RepID=UPI003611422C